MTTYSTNKRISAEQRKVIRSIRRNDRHTAAVDFSKVLRDAKRVSR